VGLELVKFHCEERVQWVKVYLDMLALFFLWPCDTSPCLLYRSYSRYDLLYLCPNSWNCKWHKFILPGWLRMCCSWLHRLELL